MVKLQDISEIPSAAIELLEAVGYMGVEDLVAANVSELHSELLKANETLRILPENPAPESIIDWQKAALGMAEKEDHSVDLELKTATLEDDPEFVEILTVIPTVEFMQATSGLNNIQPRSQVQVICISQNNLSLDVFLQFTLMHRFDRTCCTHRHKNRSLDFTVIGCHHSCPSF